MNRTELIREVAKATNSTQAVVKPIVEEVFTQIAVSLQNKEAVEIIDFGKFSRKEKPARTYRNPKTGEAVAKEAHSTVSFRPFSALKNVVN